MSGMILQGKIALVTGGGTGIDRATAEVLAAAGASVLIGDRDVNHGEVVSGIMSSSRPETKSPERAEMAAVRPYQDIMSQAGRRGLDRGPQHRPVAERRGPEADDGAGGIPSGFFRMERSRDAIGYLKSGRHFGKIVVTVGE